MKSGRIAGLLLATVTPLLAAHAAPLTFSTARKDPTWAKRFDAMFEHAMKPGWLNSATESEAVQVSLDGKPYQVVLACKRHDCHNHQIAVLFNPTASYALLFETQDNSTDEKLTWLNIGGGPESIDGKTILYAAITGSLFNHPKTFSYGEEKAASEPH